MTKNEFDVDQRLVFALREQRIAIRSLRLLLDRSHGVEEGGYNNAGNIKSAEHQGAKPLLIAAIKNLLKANVETKAREGDRFGSVAADILQ